MSRVFIIVALIGVGLASGCASMRASDPRKEIAHVVVVWLKEPGNEEHRQRLIDTGRSLRSIPGVIDVRIGRTLPTSRPIVDATFDIAMVMTFRDEGSLRAYDTHPRHVEAVRTVLQPLSAKVLIYDFDAVR